VSETGLIVSEANGTTIVDFRNTAILDTDAVSAIENELYRLVDDDRRQHILLDFSAVRFLASRMLGALVALHKKAQNIGGKVVLCGLAANLYTVFEVSRLTAVLRFARSIAEGQAVLDADGQAGPADESILAGDDTAPWTDFLKKQLRIFFAGAMVLVPLAITAWIVWSLGFWLDDLGRRAFESLGTQIKPYPGTGALILIAVIYAIGLLTHLWVFRAFFRVLERLVTRLPGAKTIYESVRDLMKLFGGESRRMGRVVQYNVPDTDMTLLGILTNENPLGLPRNVPHRKVAVYVPYSYMLGGLTVFVSPEYLVEVDMSVEQCMKLCATAQVGSGPTVPPEKRELPADSEQAP